MGKQVVRTDAAPGPFQGAPYSQAISANGFVFVAGQLGVALGGGGPVPGGVGPETEQALANLSLILEAAGSSLEQVVKTSVFLASLEDFAAMNDVYARHFVEAPPARSTIEVGRLPSGALVEIEAIALAGGAGAR
jgi:2-iminobutanoate/2-iminopropanoate deaminase